MGANDPPAVEYGTATAVGPTSVSSDAKPVKPYRSGRSLLDTMDMVDRCLRAVVVRTVNGEGGLAELARLAKLQTVMRVAVDAVAEHLLAHDEESYKSIGIALDITRQSVEARYPKASRRPPGAQQGHLR